MSWGEHEWRPVSGVSLLWVIALVVLLALFFANSDEDFLPVIDHVNLAFHEAGHIFFAIFGKWSSIFGGTLGQLLMPLLVAAAFWRSGATASFAVALIWFFENFVNVARYVADARARELPLVGGGDHDWTNLLFHWNLLQQDVVIATWLNAIAGIGMSATLVWLFMRWNAGR